MDTNEIVQIISNVGFPIAAFFLMWWQSSTVIKENTAALADNTTAIAKMLALLEEGKE